MITADKIPQWLVWAFWISPFSWAVRSVAQNEFHSDRYDRPTTDGSDGTIGDEYLRVYEINTQRELWWLGPVYLIGLYLTLSAAATFALHVSRAWPSRGTKRNQDAESLQEEERLFTEAAAAGVTSPAQLPAMIPGVVHEVRLGTGLSSVSLQEVAQDAELNFTPINLAFRDLCYYVPIESKDPNTGKKSIVEKQLLRSISGFAKAGELTALMGSSGAGQSKTTQSKMGLRIMRVSYDLTLLYPFLCNFPPFQVRQL